jgi:cytochrome c oxidase assembly factor CtaG
LSAGLATVLLLYAGGYAALALRVRRRGGAPRPLRTASFALGLVAIGVALASPLEAAAADGSLLAHMAQHELLLNVAPVLLLLGIDARLAAPVTRALVAPLARPARGRRLLLAAGTPGVALGVFAAVIAVWHIPAVYAAAAASPVLHGIEHASYLWAGLLFWFQLLRPLPTLRRMEPAGELLFLLGGTLAGAALAALLVGAPVSLYPEAVSGGPTDQQLAGGLMMAVEMPLALGIGTFVLMRGTRRPRARRGPEVPWLGI